MAAGNQGLGRGRFWGGGRRDDGRLVEDCVIEVDDGMRFDTIGVADVGRDGRNLWRFRTGRRRDGRWRYSSQWRRMIFEDVPRGFQIEIQRSSFRRLFGRVELDDVQFSVICFICPEWTGCCGVNVVIGYDQCGYAKVGRLAQQLLHPFRIRSVGFTLRHVRAFSQTFT